MDGEDLCRKCLKTSGVYFRIRVSVKKTPPAWHVKEGSHW